MAAHRYVQASYPTRGVQRIVSQHPSIPCTATLTQAHAPSKMSCARSRISGCCWTRLFAGPLFVEQWARPVHRGPGRLAHTGMRVSISRHASIRRDSGTRTEPREGAQHHVPFLAVELLVGAQAVLQAALDFDLVSEVILQRHVIRELRALGDAVECPHGVTVFGFKADAASAPAGPGYGRAACYRATPVDSRRGSSDGALPKDAGLASLGRIFGNRLKNLASLAAKTRESRSDAFERRKTSTNRSSRGATAQPFARSAGSGWGPLLDSNGCLSALPTVLACPPCGEPAPPEHVADDGVVPTGAKLPPKLPPHLRQREQTSRYNQARLLEFAEKNRAYSVCDEIGQYSTFRLSKPPPSATRPRLLPGGSST